MRLGWSWKEVCFHPVVNVDGSCYDAVCQVTDGWGEISQEPVENRLKGKMKVTIIPNQKKTERKNMYTNKYNKGNVEIWVELQHHVFSVIYAWVLIWGSSRDHSNK